MKNISIQSLKKFPNINNRGRFILKFKKKLFKSTNPSFLRLFEVKIQKNLEAKKLNLKVKFYLKETFIQY